MRCQTLKSSWLYHAQNAEGPDGSISLELIPIKFTVSTMCLYDIVAFSYIPIISENNCWADSSLLAWDAKTLLKYMVKWYKIAHSLMHSIPKTAVLYWKYDVCNNSIFFTEKNTSKMSNPRMQSGNYYLSALLVKLADCSACMNIHLLTHICMLYIAILIQPAWSLINDGW